MQFDEESGLPIAVMRTSDRNTFRSCRRKWDFGSNHRQNLGQKQHAAPLWLGTGIHFALEDFHGYNKYGSAANTFRLYVEATLINAEGNTNKLPEEIDELISLGSGMMDYYENEWLTNRNPYPTYILNDIPQVEVACKIKIPFPEISKYTALGSSKIWNSQNPNLEPKTTDMCWAPYIIYSCTFDCIAIDPSGLGLWIKEYKTAATFSTTHFDLDPQINAYYWAASQMYDLPILGILYQQHRKAVPNQPRILKNGSLSVAKKQGTTRSRYRKKALELFKDMAKFPQPVMDCLNDMSLEESDMHDSFVRYDLIYRNTQSGNMELENIKKEALEIFNPDLAIYPSPNRMCHMMCSFTAPCEAMQSGLDPQSIIESEYINRPEDYDPWRKNLKRAIIKIADRLQQESLDEDLEDQTIKEQAVMWQNILEKS